MMAGHRYTSLKSINDPIQEPSEWRVCHLVVHERSSFNCQAAVSQQPVMSTVTQELRAAGMALLPHVPVLSEATRDVAHTGILL